MGRNLLGAVLAFVPGALIAFGNYRLMKKAFMRQNGVGSVGGVTVIRQIINVAYLALVFFLAPKTPFAPLWLLIGAVVGLTVPMFLFTVHLARQPDRPAENEAPETDGKGGEN